MSLTPESHTLNSLSTLKPFRSAISIWFCKSSFTALRRGATSCKASRLSSSPSIYLAFSRNHFLQVESRMKVPLKLRSTSCFNRKKKKSKKRSKWKEEEEEYKHSLIKLKNVQKLILKKQAGFVLFVEYKLALVNKLKMLTGHRKFKLTVVYYYC